MTTLEAVNEILEALGEPPVSALDTGGSSIEGEAETMLNRVNRRVQQGGWVWNEEEEITLKVATHKIAVSGGTGTYTVRETVTESTSGATGEFIYDDGSFMYLTNLSGTFTGGETLTGGSSGATRTGAVATAVTSSKISVDTTNWLSVKPHQSEPVDFIVRGAFIYDTDDNTFTFDSQVKIDRTVLLDFTDLVDALADYIVKAAGLQFQRFKKRGQIDDQFMQDEMLRARVRANQEDTEQRRINVLKTREALRITGSRNTTFIKSAIGL